MLFKKITSFFQQKSEVPVCEKLGTAFADRAEGPTADQPESENRGHPADYDR